MFYDVLHGLRGDNVTYFSEGSCCALPYDRVAAAQCESKFWKEIDKARFEGRMQRGSGDPEDAEGVNDILPETFVHGFITFSS